MKFEYVVSACGMFRLNYKGLSTPSRNIINEVIKDHPEISFLFNAFTESNDNYKEWLDTKIFADSGGLQITTLNLNPDEVKKQHKEIYKVQAVKSDIAMNFDEMPLEVISDRSSAVGMQGRYFIHAKIEEAALRTSDNIKEQIGVFRELDSSAKIMLIGQGNDPDSYNKYLNTIISNLTDDEVNYIYGLAISGASNGSGGVESHDMIYNIRNLDVPEHLKKHIHMLGFGTVGRLSPFIYSPEFFNFVDVLSSDSTSRSRVYSIDGILDYYSGYGSLPKTNYDINKIYSLYEEVYNAMKKYFDMHPDWKGVSHWVNNNTYYSKKNTKGVWSYVTEPDIGYFSVIMITLFNVINEVQLIKDEIGKKKPIYKDIKTYDDYKKYRRQLINAYKLKSASVPDFQDHKHLDRYHQKSNLF